MGIPAAPPVVEPLGTVPVAVEPLPPVSTVHESGPSSTDLTTSYSSGSSGASVGGSGAAVQGLVDPDPAPYGTGRQL